MIDQGPHLIDLSRWFLSQEFVEVQGFAHTTGICQWMTMDLCCSRLLTTRPLSSCFVH
ncbi:hypothetical protein [Cylindrospermopsis raciborskii]|uniref:hypothetical protein n=1 Tax=Cylindrospermopsis raciborskii TaxID=77022 RepID=UPI003BF8BCA0